MWSNPNPETHPGVDLRANLKSTCMKGDKRNHPFAPGLPPGRYRKHRIENEHQPRHPKPETPKPEAIPFNPTNAVLASFHSKIDGCVPHSPTINLRTVGAPPPQKPETRNSHGNHLTDFSCLPKLADIFYVHELTDAFLLLADVD